MPSPPVDSIDLRRIAKLHLALLAAAAGLGFATRWAEPGSLVLGGLVMGLNLGLLKLATNILLASGGDPAKWGAKAALAAAGLILHLGLLLGLSAGLFWWLPLDAKSFTIGVTLLLVACVLEALRAGAKGER